MDNLKERNYNLPIINFLLGLSCCCRCIIRFLGIQIHENEYAYLNPEDFLNTLLLYKVPDDPLAKKNKLNSCPVCLNCYDLKTVEKICDSFKLTNIDEYNYNNFIFNVSFPKSMWIRSLSMLIHLKNNFPDIKFGNLYEKTLDNELVIEPPHKIFRCVVNKALENCLKKQYHPKSHLNLLITINYGKDNEEVENMKHIVKQKSNKKHHHPQCIDISRNNILEFLKDINEEKFKEHFPIPPQLADEAISVENIQITTDPIYLGGRYLKFKRNVGQTPWVINGINVTEHNVQEIISNAIHNILDYEPINMTFCASGREDLDVRMLGNGRPFYMKIDNVKHRNISKEQLLEIEKLIIKSELVAVIKLQLIYLSDLSRIKTGEEHKKKTYRALCKTTAPNLENVISIINNIQTNLTIKQLTVMRVLHRRTLMTRERIIYKMLAKKVADHEDLFELEIVTQAGSYVKEFVHGDFERTQPNISSLVGYATDLVALDCMDIDLIWPENE